MRKFVYILSVVVLVLIAVSCQEAIQNIQNPKVEYRTTIKVPLMATSVNLGGMISDMLHDISEGIPGLEVVEGTPVVLRFATTMLNISSENFSDALSGLSGEIGLGSVSLSVPGVTGFSTGISFDLPELASTDITIPVSTIPSGEYTISEVTIPINLGVDDSKVESFKVEGAIWVSLDLPDDWSDVSVSIKIRFIDGNGNEVASGTISGTGDVEGSIDLSGKEIEVGDGQVEVGYELTFNNPGLPRASLEPITLSIDFSDVHVTFLGSVEVNLEQEIPLPEGVEVLKFSSGQIVLKSNSATFTEVDGWIEYDGGSNPLGISDGAIVADLTGVSLPVTVVISKVGLEIEGDMSETTLEAEFKDLKVEEITIKNEDLAFEGEENFPLSPEARLLKEVNISSGYIKLEYEFMLPASIAINLRSPDFSPEFDESFIIEANSTGTETIDLAGRSLVLEGDTFDIEYSASPLGYDGEKLTLKDVELSTDYTVAATVSFGDLSISTVSLGGTKLEYSDSIELGSRLGEFKDAVKVLSYFDMGATVTSSLDVNATLTLEATGYTDEGEKAYSAIVPITGHEIPLTDLIGALKEVLEDAPNELEYSVAFDVDNITVDLSTDLVFDIEAEMPLVAHFDEKTLVFSYATDVKLDLEEGQLLEAATLIVEGTNTTEFTPTVEIYIDGEKKGELDFSKTMKGYITIDSEDLGKLASEGLNIEADVFLDGDQVITTTGGIDAVIKLEADVRFVTGGGE